ncbi:MAG: hypothetical protein ABMA25_17035 [Ilumatobacteraceae bacterium]
MAAVQSTGGMPVEQPVVKSVGNALGRQFGRLFGRLLHGAAGKGSTPARLRLWMSGTVVLAVLFGVLGAIGIGRRDTSLGDAAGAARQLIEVQGVQVSLVQADALASENYLRGGVENADIRTAYVQELQRVSAGLVAVGNQVLPDEAARLADVASQLGEYAGLVEQARANNRQGYPAGAAYLRAANTLVVEMVVTLRDVQASLRHQVNDNLDRADRAGAWLHLFGWALLALLLAGGVWLVRRFRRVLNLPIAAATVALFVVLLVAAKVQGGAMADAEAATAGPLQQADLVAQARAAAFDARAQEFLTLINRGNGAANEAKWTQAADTANAALSKLCGLSGTCDVYDRFQFYVSNYGTVRNTDNGGDWDGAVGNSLTTGRDVFDAFGLSSDEIAQTRIDAASDGLAASSDGLAVMRVLVFLAGLLVAALAIAGYGQRLREYR